MSTSTYFLILPTEQGDLMTASDLEQLLVLMLRRRGVEFKSRYYWADAEYETEYGVRLDISGLSVEQTERLLGEIVIVASELHGSIRVQVQTDRG